MTVSSIVNRGRKIPCRHIEKAVISLFRRENHPSFQRDRSHHFETIVSSLINQLLIWMSFQNDRSSIISKRGLIVWSPYDEGETEAGSGIEKGIGSQRLSPISSAENAQQDDQQNCDVFVNLHRFFSFWIFLSEGVVFFRKNAYIINRIFICEGVIQRERKPWYIRTVCSSLRRFRHGMHLSSDRCFLFWHQTTK